MNKGFRRKRRNLGTREPRNLGKVFPLLQYLEKLLNLHKNQDRYKNSPSNVICNNQLIGNNVNVPQEKNQ